MKPAKCKRCNTTGLIWKQNSFTGKWFLYGTDQRPHKCDEDRLLSGTCTYCKRDDLLWVDEVLPDGAHKRVLTESYGLPHGCQERIDYWARIRQEKKEKYAVERARVMASNGDCGHCKLGDYSHICTFCFGFRSFDDYTKKKILEYVRRQIWPNPFPGGRRATT